MPTARYLLAAATGCDGRIYAIGGYNGSIILNTVEAYDPATNAWTTVAPMPTARWLLAAATGSDGRIYAIGGYNGSILNTVEAYRPGRRTRPSTALLASRRRPGCEVARRWKLGPLLLAQGKGERRIGQGLGEAWRLKTSPDPARGGSQFRPC
jgi:hypothetical protein